MNATLQIPVYQRNYDWRREHCEKLFSDVEDIVRNGGTHFMGAIVYKDKKIPGMFNELIIVDGQQRITSLILLARALYDSTDDENTRQAIHATFFKHAVSNPKYKFKLQPTEYDVDIFKKLLIESFRCWDIINAFCNCHLTNNSIQWHIVCLEWFPVCITKHKPTTIIFFQELGMEGQFEWLLPKSPIGEL